MTEACRLQKDKLLGETMVFTVFLFLLLTFLAHLRRRQQEGLSSVRLIRELR